MKNLIGPKKSNPYISFAVIILSTLCRVDPAWGQEPTAGRLSGSLETNSVWYMPDRAAGTMTPGDRFGSNNYLKLDYRRGDLSAGVQYELYGPALAGFNPNLRGSKIAGKFAGWSDGKFAVTVGDFYEQFGAGLVLRSWEDRAIGFNNSLEGVRAGFSNNVISVKALWARPRLFMGYADTWARGGDVSLSLGRLTGMRKHYLALEGSYVGRAMSGDRSAGTNLWSGRLAFSSDGGFSIKGEWLGKDSDSRMINGHPAAVRGGAQLIEVSYAVGGLAIFATGRRLKNMGTKIDPDDGSEANTLNYLPALTRQYTWSLATLEPYVTEADGEQGGQFDIFYTFAPQSALGGRHGTRLHANISTHYPLEKRGRRINPLYRDVSLDIDKQWSGDFRTILAYIVQTFSPSRGVTATTTVNNVFVTDLLYKFTPRGSVRLELQYLYSRENSDWWAALAEVNFAPRWSLFVGDTYNHGGERVHYYNGGASFTASRTRIAVSYGRNRAGYVCSGGVCRYMPAYTGANFSITTSF